MGLICVGERLTVLPSWGIQTTTRLRDSDEEYICPQSKRGCEQERGRKWDSLDVTAIRLRF